MILKLLVYISTDIFNLSMICMQRTLQIRVFLIGGISYALDFSRRSAACDEQRLWTHNIGIISGVSLKKALIPQRSIAAYILNWYAINIMKQTHLHSENCRYAGAFWRLVVFRRFMPSAVVTLRSISKIQIDRRKTLWMETIRKEEKINIIRTPL